MLTQKQKRIKIAEFCGWKPQGNYGHLGEECWLDPTNKLGIRKTAEHLPNYFKDLNACHLAENFLHNEDFSNPEWLFFLKTMDKVINQRRAHATAAQRAESIYQTIEHFKL